MQEQNDAKNAQDIDRRPGPLDGLLIADFSRVLAGPYCTMLLGDLGATVIKVESPAGDDTRYWLPPEREGVGTYNLSINRNKRSLVLNFNDPADLRLAHELAARADVFIENFKPGGLKRFGLDYDAVQQHNTGIIYASISGFGTAQGASLPGYDLIVQAMSGLMSITGDADGPAFSKLCEVLEIPALSSDPRFAHPKDRTHNRQALRQLLIERLRTRTADEWFRRLSAAGIPCGPINTIQEGVAFAREIGLDPIVEVGAGNDAVPMIRHPVSFSRTPPRHELPPPKLGQDNEQIRAWLSQALSSDSVERETFHG